jgi:toxin ParE1/3/4
VIWSYLAAEASETVATRFLSRLESRIRQALALPLSGAPRSHLAPDLRVIFHQKYAVYYLPRPGEMVIVRVLHGSRDVFTIAEAGGFAT